MAHILNLYLPDNITTTTLQVIDSTVYDEDLPITGVKLEIECPGFDTPAEPEVEQHFNETLTACDLGLVTDCDPLPGLSDGIYTITLTVEGDEEVSIVRNHLKISCLLNSYAELMCQLQLNACAPPKEIEDQLEELFKIKMYIDAAKAKVEYCDDETKGMQLFEYAKTLLTKFTCHTCNA